MNRRRITVPIVLLLIGVLALVGCIPIPATQQFMPNGNLKPSWKIGRGKSNPIWLGHTTLDEAIAFLSKHVAGKQGDMIFGMNSPVPDELDIRSRWRRIDDHHFAMPYKVRTWIVVWPLCAMATAETDGRYLILITDDSNHVVDYDVISATEFNNKYSAYSKRMYPEPPPRFRRQTTLPTTRPRE